MVAHRNELRRAQHQRYQRLRLHRRRRLVNEDHVERMLRHCHLPGHAHRAADHVGSPHRFGAHLALQPLEQSGVGSTESELLLECEQAPHRDRRLRRHLARVRCELHRLRQR